MSRRRERMQVMIELTFEMFREIDHERKLDRPQRPFTLKEQIQRMLHQQARQHKAARIAMARAFAACAACAEADGAPEVDQRQEVELLAAANSGDGSKVVN